MSIKDFRITVDGVPQVAWLWCVRCTESNMQVDVGQINGLPLHAVLSMALAHDAKVHKEEK